MAGLAMALAMMAGCSRPTSAWVGERCKALDAAAWADAQWISVADAPVVSGQVDDNTNNRAADGASWFMANVTNEGKVVAAKWMTTALGTYDLYVNTHVVGREVLKPGFTHPEKTRLAYTYDITDALHKGQGETNVLAAQVTPGWWADKIVTPWGHEGMVGHKCAFRAVLALTYADGTTRHYGTDTLSWQAGIAGPITHAGIFDGEAYDARIAPGYDTPEKLTTPETNAEFQGSVVPCDGAEVYLRDDLALSPVDAYVWKDVEGADDEAFGDVVKLREYAPGEPMTVAAGETLVVDFGQNASAVPAFEFRAAEGTCLTCLPAELLNDSGGKRSRGMDGPGGSVHRDNLRSGGNSMRIDYTFADTGDAYATYQPTHTFFGYRFVAITATADVSIRSIRSVPVTSIAQELETGTITTGNDLVNKLISNTLWGQRSNYLSVPTDCPQRNERLGWMADTQVFTETGTFFADTRRFFHKWTRDVRDSQSETGAFPGVAPKAQYGSEMMRFGWADAGIIVPWTIWKQYADTAIVNENWEAMNRYLAHVNETRFDQVNVAAENGNYQWADWLSFEPLETCTNKCFVDWKPVPDAITLWSYLGGCYWAIDAAMMADMARATGRDDAYYNEMAERARTYLKEKFMNADGTFKTDIMNTMQTPALFALKNNLVEGEARTQMLARLRQNFADHDGCLQTGFLGTSILMETLTENGMQDVAYDLLFQRRNPSWLYSVDNGATTIWERWNSYLLDRGLGPQGMNSFNHYAYGCVCQWLWERAAGIATDTSQPGFRHIVMRPVPDKRLGHLEAQFRSPAGLIKSSWRYDGDEWTWQFTIPENATATVVLPGESEPKQYDSGSYQVVKTLP